MSLKIEVTVDRDEVTAGQASTYLERALMALGFSRGPALAPPYSGPVAGGTVMQGDREPVEQAMRDAVLSGMGALGVGFDGATQYIPSGETLASDDAPEQSAPAGEAPKRKRRTKAEMEAARAAEAADVPQISTGENRIGPDDPPEVAEQDAADEAAEVEAGRDASAPLTLDDVRKAVGAYQARVGFATCANTINGILGSPLIDVPETQEALAAAIARVEAATAAVPTTPAASTPPAAPAPRSATREEVMAAIAAYAEAFGKAATVGTNGADGDRQKILVKALGPTPAGSVNSKGEGVDFWTVPNIPDDKLGAALAYLEAALTENPFKRERV